MKAFPPEPADGAGPVRVMKKFDAEMASRIVTFVRGGCFIETAAAAAGISKSTLYEWMRRGRRRGRGPFFEFATDVEKALAMSEANAIGIIAKAATEGSWQAAAWHLERKYPERWGRREHVELTGEDGGPIQQNIVNVDLMPALRKLAGLPAEVQGEQEAQDVEIIESASKTG